jgi:hypothetical protein
MDSYSSAEVAFATYVRRLLGTIREIKNIGMDCVFADNGYTLHV